MNDLMTGKRIKGGIYSNSYKAIHFWLKRNFGSPPCCERCGRLGQRNGRMWSIEWALKPQREYERIRGSFEGLCRFCHRKQDHTQYISKKIWETRRKNLSYGYK